MWKENCVGVRVYGQNRMIQKPEVKRHLRAGEQTSNSNDGKERTEAKGTHSSIAITIQAFSRRRLSHIQIDAIKFSFDLRAANGGQSESQLVRLGRQEMYLEKVSVLF